ncbi:MAG: phosphodiester glycosidase family protein [Lachnospirales bacterium]
MKKRFMAILLATSFFSTTFTSSVFADSITVGSASIGGNVVTVDMSKANRTLDIALSNGSIHSDSQTSDLVKQPESDGNSTVVAGINGGFFNSYYIGTPSYPSNYPLVYGSVVKDGNIITGLGTTNAVGVTWDGEILVDRVDYAAELTFNNDFKAGLWAVGSYATDYSAISLLTSDFPYAVTTEKGSKIFSIKDNKIAGVSESGSYTVPENASLLIYNEGAVNEVSKWGNLPEVGDSVNVKTYVKSVSVADDLEKWNNVKTAVSGGRVLLQNGVNVVRDTLYNAYYDSDSKQTASVVLQRSYVATLSDGTFIMGTANASFDSIASYLISIGAVDGISLDGGASSMLYTPNNGFITSAGRRLATALVVVDERQKEVNTATGGQVIDGNTPSSWAKEYVDIAINNEIIPEYLQSGYRKDITRDEFCVLIVKLIEQKANETIDKFRQDRGYDYADAFSDTDGYFVRQCASMGLVTGSNNEFRPTDTITREEAATILKRTLNILGIYDRGTALTFGDSEKISTWAKEGVDYVTSIGIMNGVGKDFNPKGLITREQVYITMAKILEY